MTEGERGIKYFNSLNGSRRILLPSSAISASGNISASQARTTPPSRREALLARSLAEEIIVCVYYLSRDVEDAGPYGCNVRSPEKIIVSVWCS